MTPNGTVAMRPYIMDKNIGKAVDLDRIDLPTTNADGKPVIVLMAG